MTETSHLTAQEMQKQIAELESENKALARRVLGLRDALLEINKGGGVCREDEGHCIHCIAEKALTDTAQAGRDAERRIKANNAAQLGSDIGELVFLAKSQGEISGLNWAATHCIECANRLRNEGSDGE